MKIDVLISKYLDGALTPDEDSMLRAYVSADQEARSKFDTAVHRHFAMKNDAEDILPPEFLVSKTEDKVLMKIMSMQPAFPQKKVRYRNMYSLAASILLILTFGIFKIDDMLINDFKPGIASVLEQDRFNLMNEKYYFEEENSNEDKIVYQKQYKQINTDYIANDDRDAIENGNIAYNNNVNTDELNDNYIEKKFYVTPKNEIANPPIVNAIPNKELAKLEMQDFIRNPKNINIKPVTELAQQSNISEQQTNAINNVVVTDFYLPSRPIELNSFISTNFVGTGNEKTESVVNSLSQSISYAIDKSQRLGVEIGFMGVEYNRNPLSLTDASINRKKDVEGNLEGVANRETHSLVNELVDNGYRPVVGTSADIATGLLQDENLVWGAAFYEHSLLNSGSLRLDGRVGAGMTKFGGLGYGRLYAKYDLFTHFSLTLGAETKIISFSDKFNENVGFSGSVVYGFQIKF